jgi:hypothetical protein
MNQITTLTRRNIFDSIAVEEINWAGRLEEPDFLSRIFDLSKMPSSDSRFKDIYGDIWQHRVNNYDWDIGWVFTDDRFNLLNCDDSVLLQFLCETVHPIVRADVTEVSKLVQMYNDHLAGDGFEIIEKTKISGKPVFAGRQILTSTLTVTKRSAEIINALSADYVAQKITLMEGAIENSPDLAIGTAKELIETICKTILIERVVTVDKNWDLPKLMKETAKELKLAPTDIPEEARAVDIIRPVLGSLSTVVQGIAELRNHYGTGHGKSATFKGLSPRHAKLAVGAAETLAIFLIETHKIK